MVDRHVQRLRRPTYYETERARRLGLAEERRRIRRRRTVNAMPGREELLEAFLKAKDSPADMIRFGSLIEDLECYVDNTPYFKDGQLIGRRGGIRRHLEREIPELYARYKTVMRYKALSKRFRQAVGVSDPVPAASLLPEESSREQSREDENSLRNEITQGAGDGMGLEVAKGAKEMPAREKPTRKMPTKKMPIRKMSIRKTPTKEIIVKEMLAREILGACEGSVVSLAAQLEIRINPNYTPPIRTIRTLGKSSPIRISRSS